MSHAVFLHLRGGEEDAERADWSRQDGVSHCTVLTSSQHIHGTPSLANHLLAGAAAGASGAIATAPMDVIKTRLQTEVSLPRDQRRYKVGCHH